MFTRALFRSASKVRCTRAVLEAFGVDGVTPRNGLQVLDALADAGYNVSLTQDWNGAPLREFVRAHPRGFYYLVTRGHALALVDGTLVDTQKKGPDGRRIQGVAKVKR